MIEDGEEPGQAGWMNSKKFLEEEGVMRFCDGCGEPPHKTDEGIHIPLKRCSECHHAWYHNRECQKQHYQQQGGHKQDCRQWKREIKNEPRLESWPLVEYHQNDTAAGDAQLYDRVRKQWDESSETWDNNRPELLNQIFYEQFFLPTALNNNPEQKVEYILDFGCATGSLSNIMRKHVTARVIALDISPKMIEKVQANNNNKNGNNTVEAIAGCIADGEDPVMSKFRETYRNKIDLIVSTTVLPFIPPLQAKATFLALSDLLKPGTGLYCHVDFDKESLMIRYPNYITHQECETYYQWGQLEQQSLSTEIIRVQGPGGIALKSPFVLGVAKKKA